MKNLNTYCDNYFVVFKSEKGKKKKVMEKHEIRISSKNYRQCNHSNIQSIKVVC